MATEWGASVMAQVQEPVPPLVDKPLGPQGVSLDPSDPDEPLYDSPIPAGLFDQPGQTTPSALFNPVQEALNSKLYAKSQAQMTSIITGNTDKNLQWQQDYESDRTVEDVLLNAMMDKYDEEFIDTGVLDDLGEKPTQEKIERLHFEFNRLDLQKETKRNLLALSLLRQGMGNMPERTLDKIWHELTPSQTNDLYEGYRRTQMAQLQKHVESMAAREGEGFTTGVAVAEMIEQDVAPFWGAFTRVAGTREFMPEGLEIGTLRALLPGELRQEIREWWVGASNEERMSWITDMDAKLQDMRKGPNHGLYTRYLIVENLLGIFTPDLMEMDNPNDSFDRVMGNLDVALGAVIAVGLIAKRGKSIFDLWDTPKHNTARQVSAASGNRVAQSELDASIEAMAKEAGFTTADTAVKDVVKPKQMELDLEVNVDDVKHTVTPNAARQERIMEYTDEADITLLNKEDKLNAVKTELDEISNNDTMHPMHKMSTMRGLPNDTGVEFNIVFGKRGGEGWNAADDLLEDLKEVDPQLLGDYQILHRGAGGTLEELKVTRNELVDYFNSGRIPYALEPLIQGSDKITEISRFFGGRRLSKIPSEELSGAIENGWIPLDSPAYKMVRDELNDRVKRLVQAPDPLKVLDGEELFLRRNHTRFYQPKDKMDMGDAFRYWDIPIIGGATRFLGRLFPPNAKFDKVYQASRRGYLMEEAAHQEFNDMLQPFYKLNSKEQQNVATLIEYVEDYAKDMYHATGQTKMPTTSKILADNPGITEAEMEGYFAMREALDGLYDVFNRRVYRDFNNRGFVTIRSRSPGAPNYHGQPVSAPKPGSYYNPTTRKMEKLTEDDIAALVEEGGGAIKLDFPLTSEKGGKYDQVIVKRGEYEFGKLSNKPLNYYEGYHFRFYEDPFYIVKRTYGPTVNGKKLPLSEYTEEAIRTAGSFQESVRFLNRGKGRWFDNGEGEYVNATSKSQRTRFRIVPAKSISTTEGTLYQQQALHREGRLFWDQRSRERLPDTTGNRARISDPARAVQKGMAMALRQTTQEGLMKSMKNGFKEEYKNLPEFVKYPSKLNTDDLGKLEKDLVDARMNSSGQTRARYGEAIEIIRYMRSQLGTDSFLVPHLRDRMVQLAKWIDVGQNPSRFRKGLARAVTRYGMSTDPFATIRRTTYNALMVLRPVRQALLQSSQVSMLTPLAPTYIGTGRIFFDAYALRRGVAKLRRAGFDDGWSDAAVAKRMGLSTKEYKRMVEEFNRSGLLGTVNTHAFNPSAGLQKPELDLDAGVVGRMTHDVRAGGRAVFSKFAQYGFEWGEKNNLTFSYLVAVKRMKKKFGIDDLSKMSRAQLDEILEETDALALAMTRPNKFGYQSGVTGMTFQFMSFQHRALLTFAGLNPRLSKADTVKIILGNYLIWGGNILGAEDYARSVLAQAGLTNYASDELLPGITVQDLLSAGIIETGLNGLARAFDEEWHDLNIGIFAPGAAVVEIMKQMYEMLAEKPIYMAPLGPFESVASGFIQGAKFIEGDMFNNDMRSPAEKLFRAANYMGRYTLPLVNDANMAWIAYQTGQWEDKDGDSLDIQSSKATILARLALGVRGEDEMAMYKMKNLHWKDQKNITNWVEKWRPVVKEVVRLWGDREITEDRAMELVGVVHSLTEDAPEGVREEIYRQLINVPGDDGESVAALVAKLIATGTPNLLEAIPYVNQSTSMSAEEKKRLTDIMREIAESASPGEELFMNEIENDRNKRK